MKSNGWIKIKIKEQIIARALVVWSEVESVYLKSNYFYSNKRFTILNGKL